MSEELSNFADDPSYILGLYSLPHTHQLHVGRGFEVCTMSYEDHKEALMIEMYTG